jgi:hypothetical protein
VAAPRDAWPPVIARRDELSAPAARAMYPLHGLAAATALAVHGHEIKDIRWNIQVVAASRAGPPPAREPHRQTARTGSVRVRS